MIESFLFAGSTSTNSPAQNLVLSIFDIWALLTILILYFQGVQAKIKNSKPHNYSHGSSQKSKSENVRKTVELETARTGFSSTTSTLVKTPMSSEQNKEKWAEQQEDEHIHDHMLEAVTSPVNPVDTTLSSHQELNTVNTTPSNQELNTDSVTSSQVYESPNVESRSLAPISDGQEGENVI